MSRVSNSSYYVYLSLAVTVALLAAFFDLRRGEIPNWLTLGGIALGILSHALLGWSAAGFDASWRGAAFSAVGIGLCSFAPFVCYRLSAMGAGDAKLLAAMGAICGPILGVEAQFYALVALSIFCAIRLTYQGRLLRMLGHGLFVLARPFFKRLRTMAVEPEVLLTVRAAPAVLTGLLLAAALHVGH